MVENKLIVIENGQLNTYELDNKRIWQVGRPTKDNRPDIKLYSATVSRKHGSFRNTDGIWFYLDNNGKNGTIYNNKHIEKGINGKIKPVMLKDGDILIFGGGEQPVINCKTVWAMHIADTSGWEELSFIYGEKNVQYKQPQKGTVIRQQKGMAIYMGDITYLSGNMNVIGV